MKRQEGLKDYLHNKERVLETWAKVELTNLERYGVRNAMQNPEIRRKSLKHHPVTAPEKYITELLLMRSIPFEFQYECNGKCWDFGVFNSTGALELIIEVDGEYHHGLLNDPFNSHVGGHKDPERFSRIPEGVKYLEVDAGKVKEAVPEIMRLVGINYELWISDLYNACSSMGFPYPEHTDFRMKKDWTNLCKAFIVNEFSSMSMPGNSIITQFHKSIYDCHVNNQISPVQAWNTPELLMKCIENRFVYRSVLSTQQIARGFERNKIAPRVTVFQPSLARYLLSKYAPDAKTVVDPFSGFSGRMLGAASLGMKYVGYDIREETINESNQIIKYLDLQNCTVSVADFETNVDDNEYDVLLTCSPYGNKEVWSDGQACQKVDYYIEHCLRKFKAKTYVFVIDKSIHPIAEYIGRRSHMSEKSKEAVVVFRRD